ncbi:hypothetical protein Sjap_003347 [Stephania japonica]|uniref:Uncharacterized protein n=1 Tax=Stephania japonica TaxID=461633 RepID=A0AAP0KQN8_9MAGN
MSRQRKKENDQYTASKTLMNHFFSFNNNVIVNYQLIQQKGTITKVGVIF